MGIQLTKSERLDKILDMALALLIRIGGEDLRTIYSINYDITRILNSNSWKESVLTTLVIKDPKTKKKRPEYSVLVQTVSINLII